MKRKMTIYITNCIQNLRSMFSLILKQNRSIDQMQKERNSNWYQRIHCCCRYCQHDPSEYRRFQHGLDLHSNHSPTLLSSPATPLPSPPLLQPQQQQQRKTT
uniref:Uncharacterized protein n=1 Tax=Opuntia streptacantha TaxID=393608 RepID=A0A7C9EJL9_OPUST